VSKEKPIDKFDLEKYFEAHIRPELHQLHEAVYYDRSARSSQGYLTQTDRLAERFDALAELLGVEFYVVPEQPRKLRAERVKKGRPA